METNTRKIKRCLLLKAIGVCGEGMTYMLQIERLAETRRYFLIQSEIESNLHRRKLVHSIEKKTVF
jgi:hypothetical protein